jgi:hypothetical protein
VKVRFARIEAGNETGSPTGDYSEQKLPTAAGRVPLTAAREELSPTGFPRERKAAGSSVASGSAAGCSAAMSESKDDARVARPRPVLDLSAVTRAPAVPCRVWPGRTEVRGIESGAEPALASLESPRGTFHHSRGYSGPGAYPRPFARVRGPLTR